MTELDQLRTRCAELERENAGVKTCLRQQAEAITATINRHHSQMAELEARFELLREVHLISETYDRIRSERVFAIDDIEYDLFAAGWKAAIDAAREG